jgi:hypothetical protein
LLTQIISIYSRYHTKHTTEGTKHRRSAVWERLKSASRMLYRNRMQHVGLSSQGLTGSHTPRSSLGKVRPLNKTKPNVTAKWLAILKYFEGAS